ncbi:MAG TPA: hypothetical protein DCL49_01345 [Candidatus Omnitrophica bacterium]|nr:hypothetical protein [Candidatus Omnitrophota bacterium]
MLEMLFWFLLILIFYVYFGYPFFLVIISFFFTSHVKKHNITPFVSIIISVHNEENVVKRKIENCLDLDYPKEEMEIIIGSDNSMDKTDDIINEYTKSGVLFYKFGEQRGKVSVLNELVPKAKGEIIIFSDARQVLDKNALKELVKNFADENVGAVSGELFISGNKESAVSDGVGLYWDYEKFLRKLESQIGSTVGVTGAIYAIRKKLYVPPRTDTLLDDVFIPMKAVEKGYRVIFEPLAKAYDTFSKTPKEEAARKVRTLAGNWQIFFRMKNMFNPLKSKVALQLFSHKLLRVLIPYFLIILLLTNYFLLGERIYNIFFILQLGFYLSALAGYFLISCRIKLFNISYTFCMLNYMAIKGLFVFLTDKQKVVWK